MKIKEVNQQRILLSVLNWGFGHVTRSIAIIEQLLAQKNQIFIACDIQQKTVFQSYLSEEVTYIDHAGYPFDFKGRGNFGEDLFDNRRRLVKRFSNEQQEVNVYVDTLKIDLVISDHRYGFFTKKCPSIFITHQLHLPLKWYQKPIQWIHKSIIQHNFSTRWIMDDTKHSLAGKLSDQIGYSNNEIIGFYSRFQRKNNSSSTTIPYVAILSGPKVYAEQLLKELIVFSNQKQLKIVCICTYPFLVDELEHPFIEMVNTTDWNEMDALILKAETIISRTGYSTLMDLHFLNKKAILIPTNGQAEQLYLAKLHVDHPQWKIVKSLKEIN